MKKTVRDEIRESIDAASANIAEGAAFLANSIDLSNDELVEVVHMANWLRDDNTHEQCAFNLACAVNMIRVLMEDMGKVKGSDQGRSDQGDGGWRSSPN